MEYYVTMHEHHTTMYAVEAETIKQAIEMIKDGEGEPIEESDFIKILTSEGIGGVAKVEVEEVIEGEDLRKALI